MLDGIFVLQSWVALAGSQIETAIFLKTLNVNTMMSNTEHGGKDYFGKDNLRRCDGTWESF